MNTEIENLKKEFEILKEDYIQKTKNLAQYNKATELAVKQSKQNDKSLAIMTKRLNEMLHIVEKINNSKSQNAQDDDKFDEDTFKQYLEKHLFSGKLADVIEMYLENNKEKIGTQNSSSKKKKPKKKRSKKMIFLMVVFVPILLTMGVYLQTLKNNKTYVITIPEGTSVFNTRTKKIARLKKARNYEARIITIPSLNKNGEKLNKFFYEFVVKSNVYRVQKKDIVLLKD